MRKQWGSLFPECTVIVFFVGLNLFNDVMWQNENKNAMQDSIEVWEELLGTERLAHASFVFLRCVGVIVVRSENTGFHLVKSSTLCRTSMYGMSIEEVSSSQGFY